MPKPLCAKMSTHGKIYHCNLCAGVLICRYYQKSEAQFEDCRITYYHNSSLIEH